MKRTPLIRTTDRMLTPLGRSIIHLIEKGQGGLPGPSEVFTGDYAALAGTAQVFRRDHDQWTLLDTQSHERMEVFKALRLAGVKLLD